MKLNSWASKLFSLLNFNFFAPRFILYEFKKYEDECLRKSGLSKKNFRLRKKEIFSKIEFVNFYEYKGFLIKAMKISLDPDDAPYLALALKLQVPIWSNDKQLKNQEKISVLSTKDIIELVF